MTEYQVEQTSQTFHTAKITTRLLASTFLLLSPNCVSERLQNMLPSPDSNNSVLSRNYSFTESGASSTYQPYNDVLAEHYSSFPNTDFERAITDFFVELSSNQESLGSEFKQVLFENLWDLYQS